MTTATRLDDMTLTDLMEVALADPAAHGPDISRAYLLKAVVLGRQAEHEHATFVEQVKVIIEATVWLAATQARRRAVRRERFRRRARAAHS